MRELSELREELDVLDRQVVELYAKRMGIAEEVAAYKIGVGKPVLDMEREKSKIDTLTSYVDTPFLKQGIKELYEQIMTNSRKRQYQIMQENGKEGPSFGSQVEKFSFDSARVVYQGVPGAYSQIAMRQFFGDEVDGYAVDSWRDAMEQLKLGKADYAVLPIENSTKGIIAENHDLLASYDYFIVGEQIIEVNHCLLGVPGATIDDINQVYSHPQAIFQCNDFLVEHSYMRTEALENTAKAAKLVKEEGKKNQAAIASIINAELYGLEVLAEGIQDRKDNKTRFVIVSPQKKYSKEANKISISYEIPHNRGSLYHSLSHFIFNDINLCRIESRPSLAGQWEYRFFVDIEGNLDDIAVKQALYGLSLETNNLQILGNFVSRT